MTEGARPRPLRDARAMVNLLQSIAHELHDLERTQKHLAQLERPTTRERTELLEVQVRREECLRELAELGVELVHDTPLTFHLQAVGDDGQVLSLCWVTGESTIDHHHPQGASPGSARRRL